MDVDANGIDEDLGALQEIFLQKVTKCQTEAEQKECYGQLVAEAKKRRLLRLANTAGG